MILTITLLIIIVLGFIGYKNNWFTNKSANSEDTSMVVKEFLDTMIPHYEEAAKVSQPIMNDLSISEPKVRILAANIVDNQSFEMMQMINIYTEFFGGSYTSTTTYKSMKIDTTNLKGDDLAKVYIKNMIKHHELSIKIAKKYIKKLDKIKKASSYTENGLTIINTHPSLDLTYDMAKKIIEEQNKEIELMEKIY